jgi:hypothetical protein
MLYEFLESQRAVLIERCRAMVALRTEPKVTSAEFTHGIPIFLNQLSDTLRIEQTAVAQPGAQQGTRVSGRAGGGVASEIGAMATLHGRDLLKRGFTLDQVVHDYGDICQAITNLAYELDEPIKVDEFRTLNRCLDIAIAGAVTEYALGQSAAAEQTGLQANNTRVGLLAVELRNYVQTAILAIGVIKSGNVGYSGATAGLLERCLAEMSGLIDRSLAEVKATAAS